MLRESVMTLTVGAGIGVPTSDSETGNVTAQLNKVEKRRKAHKASDGSAGRVTRRNPRDAFHRDCTRLCREPPLQRMRAEAQQEPGRVMLNTVVAPAPTPG